MFNNKKRYFSRKIEATLRTVWDLEFKLFKMREIREEIRQERDEKASKVFNLEEDIKREGLKLGLTEDKVKECLEATRKNDDGTIVSITEEKFKEELKENKDELLSLIDKRTLLKRDIDRFDAQMKAIDLEMYGTKPTGEYPNGVQGIDFQIDSFVELKGMLKAWKKTL